MLSVTLAKVQRLIRKRQARSAHFLRFDKLIGLLFQIICLCPPPFLFFLTRRRSPKYFGAVSITFLNSIIQPHTNQGRTSSPPIAFHLKNILNNKEVLIMFAPWDQIITARIPSISPKDFQHKDCLSSIAYRTQSENDWKNIECFRRRFLEKIRKNTKTVL